MARKTGKTPEQRKAEAEALHARLADQVEALASSDAWEKFLTFAQSFHTYSLNNVLLILSQRPEASRVAGFRQWQAKGRQVRKGEKGIKILGYSTKKITAEDENGDETERVLRRFPILTVFDIGQTDPIEGAEQVDDLTAHVEGDDVAGIAATVTGWLLEQGWAVDVEPIDGPANGYTTTDGSRRVVIDSSLSPAQTAKTTVHEAAHVILHSDEPVSEYVEHRGVKETEAESVAYVVAGLAGLDTSAYSVGYVAGWAKGDAAVIRAAAENVMRAVHVLAPLVDTERENATAETVSAA
jgi:antirestriction protein ArdC